MKPTETRPEPGLGLGPGPGLGLGLGLCTLVCFPNTSDCGTAHACTRLWCIVRTNTRWG